MGEAYTITRVPQPPLPLPAVTKFPQWEDLGGEGGLLPLVRVPLQRSAQDLNRLDRVPLSP
jgi:hypothetical protein